MRPAFLLAVFVLLALTLTGAGATSLSSCTTYSSCYTDYVETSYTAAGDYTHLVLRLCFNAVPTSSVMYACTWNGTKGSGCITYTANSTNITNTGASCAGGGGTYGDVYFWNLTIEDGVKYWFGFWNVTPVGCVWGKTSSCGSLTPQGAGTSWGATQLYSLGTLTASAAPDMVINMPVDGGVYNVTFTFQTNEVDLDGCDAPMTLYRRFYNSYAVELGRNDTNLTGAGTQYWSINSTQWGTGFYAIPVAVS